MLPDLRTTEGRLFFASSDSAIAWRSFIDGAIEGGYHAARDIDNLLTAVGHRTRSAADWTLSGLPIATCTSHDGIVGAEPQPPLSCGMARPNRLPPKGARIPKAAVRFCFNVALPCKTFSSTFRSSTQSLVGRPVWGGG